MTTATEQFVSVNAGHGVPADNPEDFEKAVLDFLAT